MKKKVLLDILKNMDEEFEIEELISKLLFVREVDLGLRNVQEGRVLNYDEIKQKFKYGL
jgi:hypothetical protein